MNDQIFDSAAELPWRPKHPGHFVQVDILEPYDLTQQQLADALQVSRRSINELVRGRRELTVEMARRLSEYTGQSAEYWRNLQAQYEMWESRDRVPSFCIDPLVIVEHEGEESKGALSAA